MKKAETATARVNCTESEEICTKHGAEQQRENVLTSFFLGVKCG